MNLLLSRPSCDTYFVSSDGQQIGTLQLTDHPFHRSHRNLILSLEDYSEELAPGLIALLRQYDPHPLKFMTESTDTQRIRFARAAGFRLARRCYARCFPPDWCKNPLRSTMPLETTHRHTENELEWVRCAALLYEQYAEKHASISPLTAQLHAFQRVLPDCVWFVGSENRILHFAFVEDNEIAYVGTTEPDTYPDFLGSVLSRIFSRYETVEFEADDHDPQAMMLKQMFSEPEIHSWNTYLLA